MEMKDSDEDTSESIDDGVESGATGSNFPVAVGVFAPIDVCKPTLDTAESRRFMSSCRTMLI